MKKHLVEKSFLIKKSSLATLLLLCVGINSNLQGGWFSSGDSKSKKKKDNVPAEVVHRRLDQKGADRFMRLVQLRSNIAQELVVFERVQEEKKTEIMGYDERFIKVHRMIPELRYRYEPSSNVLFRIDELVENKATNTVETFVKQLEPEAGQVLFKDMLGKTLANQQLQSLALLIREKNQESVLVNDALFDEFGIEPRSRYRYDDDRQTIVRIINKESASVPAAGRTVSPAKPSRTRSTSVPTPTKPTRPKR